jgi:hypothetical protein
VAEVTAFRNNALPYPVYGVPWAVVYPFQDADGDLVTGATTPDAEVSLNGNTFADCTNESVEIATNSGVYYLLLTGAEMTADIVTVIAKSATAGMKTTVFTLYPRKLVSLRTGTCAGGAAGSMTLDASASAVDDFYNGCLVVGVLDAATEARIITDYTGSTQVAAVTPNWNTTPDSDDTFTVYLPEGRQINQANVSHWNSLATVSLPLIPTTAGRTLDVSAGGEAGVDWANVGSATTTVGLSGTTVKTATDVETDTQDIQGRLPAALTGGGNIKADALALSGDTTAADNAESFFDGTGYAGTNNVIPTVTTTGTATAVTTVNGLAANVITATSIANDAITAAKIADNAIDAGAIAADAITAAKIADGAIDAATFASGAIDATAIAADAITAAKIADGAIDAATFAASAITATAIASNAITAAKIADGAIDAATFAAGAIDATAIAANAIGASELAADAVAEIADAVWDEVMGDHVTSGTTGAALNGAGAAADPWGTALPGAYGAGTAGKIIGDNINATISSRSTVTTAQVNTECDTALSDVGLTATITGRIDAAVTTRATPAQVNTEVLDCLVTDTHAEVSAVPAATSSLKDKINWLFALARNKLTQTSTTQTLRNDGDSGSIATSAVADDATTASRAKWS